MSLNRLRHLGAPFLLQRRLLRGARKEAWHLVWSLKVEIYAVAKALRQHRELTEAQIDAAIGPRSQGAIYDKIAATPP